VPVQPEKSVSRAGTDGCLRSLQVLGCDLAVAGVANDVEAHLLAFDERAHARALDGGDVNENIRLAIVEHDEAKTLGGVEELNGSSVHDYSLSIGIECVAPGSVPDVELFEIEKENRRYAQSAKTKFISKFDRAYVEGYCGYYKAGAGLFF